MQLSNTEVDTLLQPKEATFQSEHRAEFPAGAMGHYILAGDGSMILERRATPRYEISVNVDVAVSAGGASMAGRTVNLSEAGAQIVLPVELAVSTGIDIAFPAFEGRAEVVWCRREEDGVRVGMRFVHLSATSRRSLRDLVARAVERSSVHA